MGWDLGLAVEGIGWFGIFCNMLVAVAMVHHQFGFFMNWAGTQKGEGFEFRLLALAMTVFLMIRGAGAASIDRLLFSSAGCQSRCWNL